MRRIIKIFLLLLLPVFCNAQSKTIDSLKQLLQTEKQDTSRVMLLNQLSAIYSYSRPDTALLLAQQGLLLAKKIGFIKGEAQSMNNIANVFSYTGNYPKALQLHLEAIKIAEATQDKKTIARVLTGITLDYSNLGDARQSINYQLKSLAISKIINDQLGITTSTSNLGDSYEKLNILDSAEIYTNRAYDLAVQQNDLVIIGIALNNLGNIYSKMGQPGLAMNKYRLSIPFLLQENIVEGLCEVYLGMAKLFQKAGNTDSSLYYAKLSLAMARKGGSPIRVMNASIFLTGYYTAIQNVDSAFVYQSASIAANDSLFSQEKQRVIQGLNFDETIRQQQIKDAKAEAQTQLKFNMLLGGLFSLFVVAFILYRNNRQKQKANFLLQKQKNEIDSKAKELEVQKENLEQSYNNIALLGEIGRKITASLSVETIIGTVYDNVNSLMDASVFGIGIYHDDTKQIEFASTYEKGKALPVYSHSINDENRLAGKCFNSGKEIVIGDFYAEYSKYLQKVPLPSHGDQPVSLIYLPLTVNEKMLGVITVQSFSKSAFSAYHLYMLRTIAIYAAIALENAESFNKLNHTVDSLKHTQKQLIQSEKMASLGELTAGIAHEIQNPLNFVNNFSEVNTELIEELKEERKKEVRDFKNEDAILNDIASNEQKINHHGKRAGDIVKGMLQHSRNSSSAVKEPTDINKLADEYLRLAYHGLRAKDKSFNATMKTDFDESLSANEAGINIIPQDIGRVVLNLITNAFYAASLPSKGGFKDPDYKHEPTVWIKTSKTPPLGGRGAGVLISVRDNGPGIPQKVLDKIFQPFFTTKPSGQGTGLGLSLSYDIVKAHGGEIKVETKEGEGTEFIISLPV